MKKARDIMTSNPRAVTPNDSAMDAARIMRDTDVGIVPVVDDTSSMRLRGVVTDRDIAVRCIAEGRTGECGVTEVMSSDIVTARPDDELSTVMDRMKAEQVRRIPVVDDNQCLVGIIAQADIAYETSDRKTGDVVEKISQPGARR